MKKPSPMPLSQRLKLRPSKKADHAAIAQLLRKAFAGKFEEALALALIESDTPTISLVGQCDGRIAGHVLLSEIGAPVKAMALAPLAVLPAFREMQVGSRLVEEAIRCAAKAGYEAIFVLGDNPYYERFGFASAPADAFDVVWQGPHFMALELKPGVLAGKTGRLNYPAAFFGSDY
jgi:putative acetyltransferase